MDKLFDILAYCIPALVVLGCVYVVLMQVFGAEREKRRWEMRKASQKEITPTRLRAYERLALLLERTQPEHMLLEINVAELSISELQRTLLHTIRQEFDHNLSQQIYVSSELWDKILSARDQVAAFVTAMTRQLPEGATTLDYAQVLMTSYMQNGTNPHEIAMMALKEEVKLLMD